MRNRNVFWGLIFILAAALVLLNNFGFFQILHVGNILLTIILVYCAYDSLRRLEFFGVLFPIAILCIIYAKPLHITAITPWPVLAAALFGSIGLSFLFPKHPHPKYKGEFETADHLNESDVSCTVTFAGTTKYIDTPDFRRAYLKCSFGSLKAFFDHAQITGDTAEIYIDNSFGETELYFPKEWNVKIEATASFGDIEEIHRITQSGSPVVILRGHVSFGDCKIYYI